MGATHLNDIEIDYYGLITPVIFYYSLLFSTCNGSLWPIEIINQTHSVFSKPFADEKQIDLFHTADLQHARFVLYHNTSYYIKRSISSLGCFVFSMA